jgi:hypothetical protein
MNEARCSVSGKIKFANKQQAWAAIENLKRRARQRGGEAKVRRKRPPAAHGEHGAYQCPHCKSFHISAYTGDRS